MSCPAKPQGFWRNWHASYNQWLVRYMYIPLGGTRWRALNVWAIFTFVAVWHDLEWRLLGWAWIMALFMAPEMVSGRLLYERMTSRPDACVLMYVHVYIKLCLAAIAVHG